MLGALIQPTCTGAPLSWSTSYWLMAVNHLLLLLMGAGLMYPFAFRRGKARSD